MDAYTVAMRARAPFRAITTKALRAVEARVSIAQHRRKSERLEGINDQVAKLLIGDGRVGRRKVCLRKTFKRWCRLQAMQDWGNSRQSRPRFHCSTERCRATAASTATLSQWVKATSNIFACAWWKCFRLGRIFGFVQGHGAWERRNSLICGLRLRHLQQMYDCTAVAPKIWPALYNEGCIWSADSSSSCCKEKGYRIQQMLMACGILKTSVRHTVLDLWRQVMLTMVIPKNQTIPLLDIHHRCLLPW